MCKSNKIARTIEWILGDRLGPIRLFIGLGILSSRSNKAYYRLGILDPLWPCTAEVSATMDEYTTALIANPMDPKSASNLMSNDSIKINLISNDS